MPRKLMSELAAGVAHKMRAQMTKQKMSASAASLHVVDALERVRPCQAVPINCFPMEYILGQVGIPLGKILTIQGPTESSKSSLFWWMARMFLAHGGDVVYFDLEKKHEDSLAHAYIGNPAARLNRVAVYQMDCVDAFATTLASLGQAMLRNKPYRPTLIGIDTLGATLTSKFMENLAKGNSVVGYSAAHAIMQLQAAMQTFVTRYMNLLPVTLCCLQQQKVRMETQERYASGGTNAGFARSIALSMYRCDWQKSLDRAYPILSIGQEKQSTNTRRNLKLRAPTSSYRNSAGFMEYSFQWHQAFAQLLAELPATYLDGLAKFSCPTKGTISVVPAKNCMMPDVLHRIDKGSLDDVGMTLFDKTVLLEELRTRTDLVQHPVWPYECSGLASPLGGMWLGPEETSDWQEITQKGPEAVHAWHAAFVQEHQSELMPDDAADLVDDDETDTDEVTL